MIHKKITELDIYQSHIGENQLKMISPFAIPYDVSHNTAKDSREYECFKEIFKIRSNNPRPWGMVSWKFEHKTLIPIEDFLYFAKLKFSEGYDCVFINPMIGNEAIYKNVWEQGSLSHKGFNKITSFLMQKLPKTINSVYGKNTFSFCNYFIATPKFWLYYFKFVDAIIYHLNKQSRERTDVGVIWSGTAHYPRDPNVTMRPFVIERLFSALLTSSNNAKFCDYPYNISNYNDKFGIKLGSILSNLSDLKNSAITENDAEKMKRWQLIRVKLFKSDARGPIVTLDDPPNILLDNDVLSLDGTQLIKEIKFI